MERSTDEWPIIPNRDLRTQDVPAFDPTELAVDAGQYQEFDRFSQTFSGYDFVGMEAEAARSLGRTFQDGILGGGSTDSLGLSWLRALLFLQQRDMRWTFSGEERWPEKDAKYISFLYDAIREEIRRQPEQISTKRLHAADVPEFEAEQLIKAPRHALAQVWRFARTFDAKAYFGVMTIHGRLGAFSNSLREEFFRTGVIPPVAEIGMLRTCLAYEERRWCTGTKSVR